MLTKAQRRMLGSAVARGTFTTWGDREASVAKRLIAAGYATSHGENVVGYKLCSIYPTDAGRKEVER